MLKVENISTGYGKKQVLFNVSLEVKQGEIVLLAGGNGSGKSTLLKAIYGLLPIWNEGQVFFNREDITGRQTSDLLKKGILYVPQKNNLFEDLTVRENLQMAGLTITDKAELQRRIEYVLSVFGVLKLHLDKKPMKMSGGERTLLTLAMATLYSPKVILLDEPLVGLSFKNIIFVNDCIKKLNEDEGVGFLIVEHRIKECLKIIDKIIGIKMGGVLKIENVNSTFQVTDLKSIFT